MRFVRYHKQKTLRILREIDLKSNNPDNCSLLTANC